MIQRIWNVEVLLKDAATPPKDAAAADFFLAVGTLSESRDVHHFIYFLFNLNFYAKYQYAGN